MGFNILDLFLPRETKFFTYMSDQVDCFYEAALVFKEMVYHIEELNDDEIRKKWIVIKDCELRGDNIERRIIDELENTFITPIDREDIHSLAINSDRTIDILNTCHCRSYYWCGYCGERKRSEMDHGPEDYPGMDYYNSGFSNFIRNNIPPFNPV